MGQRSTPRQVVLVTGALGYIGSHTIVELLLSGLPIDILALDNLSNSSIDVLDQINLAVAEQSTAETSQSSGRWRFVEADITHEDSMRDLFSQSFCQGRPITAVIHFAALKSVVESIQQPLKYYRENVAGLAMLASIMQDWNCKQLIFSSSATVYGSMSGSSQCAETLCRHTAGSEDIEGIQGSIGLSNPYARTKWMCEAILHDACAADADFKAVALRYFNPVGAHSSGHLRESPKGAPTNLVPCITRAMESQTTLQIFGTDYKTADGSAVRDFIHVVDLAHGHVSALHKLFHDAEKRSGSRGSLGGYPWYRTNPTFVSKRSHSSSSSDTISAYSCSSDSEKDLPDTPPTPSSDLFSSGELEGHKGKPNELEIFNLGTGTGSSVKEILAAMREASGQPIPAIETDRRPGDIAISVADPTKANEQLGWRAQRTMADACRDVCRSMFKST